MTLRLKLTAAILGAGLVPLFLLSWLAYRAANTAGDQARQALASEARDANDKIDRNLFERYGDAQAFASNPALRDRSQWYQVGAAKNSIAAAANRYAALYGLYPKMLIADRDGKLVATNDRDASGNPISSQSLYARNYRDEVWFEEAVRGKFLRAEGSSLTGTSVVDVRDDDGRKVIIFAAPILAADNSVTGVWANFADFAVVEEILKSTYDDLKARGYGSAQLTLARRDGSPIAAYPVQRTSAGGAQATAEALSKGALGYAGLGWKLTIGVDEAELLSFATTLRLQILAVTSACLLVLLGVAWVINHSVTTPLYEARAELQREVNELRNGSAELGRVSETLAHSAVEQGSSVDRTSSAITQIHGIVQRGKNMSAEVHASMTAFESVFGQSRQQLDGVGAAMERIYDTARHLTTMLRSIEEVAFQANLLALNASVEAARAGSAGSGFAVVADAFRGLAKKAGDSAKGSYQHIEAQRTQSEHSQAAVEQLRKGFREVSQRVDTLIRMSEEAAAAISQETTGVHEIDQALTTIHQAATRTAEGAQSNRRFGEELTVQAERTAEVVMRLGQMLDGGETRTPLNRGAAPSPAL